MAVAILGARGMFPLLALLFSLEWRAIHVRATRPKIIVVQTKRRAGSGYENNLMHIRPFPNCPLSHFQNETMRNHANENEFDLHKNGRAGKPRLHINGFAIRLLFDSKAKGNSEIYGLFHVH